MSILDTDRRILTLAFARMMDSIGNSFLIVVLPLYIASGVIQGDTFGLGTAVVTGIILSAFGFFNSFLQPFTGNLSDRTGRRRIFVILGLVILGIANFAYTLAGSYDLVLLVRMTQGIGVALTVPATIALVNDLSTDAGRGGSMGVFNTFRMLGFGLGPVLAGGVIHGGPYHVLGVTFSGFEAAFYIATLGAFVGASLVLLLVSDPEPDPDEDAADAANDFGIAVFERDGPGVLDSVFTLGLASLFMAVGIALLSTIEPQINEHLDQTSFLFGVEFSAFVLAQVLLQAPIGAWSDTYGRKPFILAGLALLVPATLAQGFVSTPAGMIVARFLQGAAGAAVFAPAMALAGDIARGSNSGTTLSVLTMSFGLGTAIGPLSSGYLSGFSLPVGASYATPFVFGALLAALGFVLVYTQVEETIEGESFRRRLVGRQSESAD
ncbi:MFS transporter [Halocalculus aciditolerans]|uniref:MFS transporter n=1 Tax=Halocalculus aciditolerans TaxID=1383812 RepID=A0A830FHN3_9EURY|nr:MFS transporter [Halocalculus aciditolerans]GGL57080.1 MFS transporter [Halocalculus aciditolerans]